MRVHFFHRINPMNTASYGSIKPSNAFSAIEAFNSLTDVLRTLTSNDIKEYGLSSSSWEILIAFPLKLNEHYPKMYCSKT